MKTCIRYFAAMALAGLIAGCAGRKVSGGGRSGTDGAVSATAIAGGVDASRTIPPEPDVRGMTARSVPELKQVRFAYDSDHLDSSARFALKANLAYLAEHPLLKIQVAGHCDQRGTVSYNLALGQRRASAVRDYYRLLGADASRVATISYGRERPACEEQTEACWGRNRRAESLVMIDEGVAVKKKP